MVLVVIVAIFTGRIGRFEWGVQSEEEKAKLQAAAFASNGVSTTDCSVLEGSATANGRCVQPEDCATNRLLTAGPRDNPEQVCVQGLVCYRG